MTHAAPTSSRDSEVEMGAWTSLPQPRTDNAAKGTSTRTRKAWTDMSTSSRALCVGRSPRITKSTALRDGAARRRAAAAPAPGRKAGGARRESVRQGRWPLLAGPAPSSIRCAARTPRGPGQVRGTGSGAARATRGPVRVRARREPRGSRRANEPPRRAALPAPVLLARAALPAPVLLARAALPAQVLPARAHPAWALPARADPARPPADCAAARCGEPWLPVHGEPWTPA